MDGSDCDETRDVVRSFRHRDLSLERSHRPAPLCYTKDEQLQPEPVKPRYDLLVAAVTVSAAVGFATLCLAIA